MKAKIAHKTRLIKQNFTLGLLVVLLFTLMAFSITAIADEEETTTGGNTTTEGMQINKTATYNEDTDNYTITLEAYATGQKVTTTVQKDVPTDIILVLDQSGSMAYKIGEYEYNAYKNNDSKNSNLYSYRHNGGNANLWYQLKDGSYVSVSVNKTTTWKQLDTNMVNYKTNRGGLTTDCYYYYSKNLYEKVGDEYKKVTVKREYVWSREDGYYKYTYTFSNGDKVSSEGDDTKPDFGAHGPLYTPDDDSNTVYTYSYTDANGNVQNIGTSTGANTNFTDATLYSRKVNTDAGEQRLVALKNAVKAFADSVNKKAKGADGEYGTADDINHRIAVVGFASGGSYDSYNKSQYENTEVFVGKTQYKYGTGARGQYSKAFQDMNTKAGYDNVIASKDALEAYGGTYTNLGMEMANGILKENPVNSGETRNRVVIVFTDGYPGTDSTSVNSTVANNAVSQAYTAKHAYNATVYTIGIFSGADGTPVENLDDVSDPNRFMHLTSSNYKNAQSYSESTEYGTSTYPTNGSYYLTAADADDLNDIFQQISHNIENDPTTTTLNENTVIKDIIAPQFQLPEGADEDDITLETYAYTVANTWTKNNTAMGATASIDGDNVSVSVTGFDFADNWCGTETTNGSTTYRGNKLVIKFNVQTKDGFLGGNDVYTNTSAGVYENADATEPVMTFNRPQVNVPIEDVTVGAADKNVYLLGNLTAEQIKSGATAKCGAVELKLGETDYGLESWQTDYVDITVTYKDAAGNTITDLNNLQDDTTYTVSVTVSPQTNGSTTYQGTVATEKSGNKEGKINVFKPELTFKDSEVYYGDEAPTDYSGKKTAEVWKHDTTTSTDTGVAMIGTAPALALTYTPDEDKVKDGKIAVKTDIPVDVTVKIGEGDNATDVTDKTTFVHTSCEGKTCDVPEGKEFLLHVNTCTLTITKQACTGVAFGANESFVFNIKKDNAPYTQVTIGCDANGKLIEDGSVTISELPVGNYTVEEDTNWSWRYNPSYSSETATLSSDKTSGAITCTNKLSKEQWLNGFSTIVKNVFGGITVQ